MDWVFLKDASRRPHRGAIKDFEAAWEQGYKDASGHDSQDSQKIEREAHKKIKELQAKLVGYYIPSMKGPSAGDNLKWCAAVMTDIAYESGRIHATTW